MQPGTHTNYPKYRYSVFINNKIKYSHNQNKQWDGEKVYFLTKLYFIIL